MGADGNPDNTAWTPANIAAKLDNTAAAAAFSNENGTYTVAKVDGTNNITITGKGKAVRNGKSPQVVTTITFPAGTITAAANDVDA